MSSVGREISDLKLNAYSKIHIPTKNEVMEEIIAIGKIIAGSLESSKPLDDIKVIFVENNTDLEFFGFVGDGAGTIDTEGNLIHIGDSVKMFRKDGYTSKHFALKILPKQKSINFLKGKVVKSYKELQKKNGSWEQGIYHFVSCLEEYLKSVKQTDTEKKIKLSE